MAPLAVLLLSLAFGIAKAEWNQTIDDQSPLINYQPTGPDDSWWAQNMDQYPNDDYLKWNSHHTSTHSKTVGLKATLMFNGMSSLSTMLRATGTHHSTP